MKVSREADTGSNPMAHQKAYGSLQQVWAFAVRENYRQEVPILQDLMSHHHEKGVTRP